MTAISLLPPTPDGLAARVAAAEELVHRRLELLHHVVDAVECHGQAIPGAVALAELRAGDAIRDWVRLAAQDRGEDAPGDVVVAAKTLLATALETAGVSLVGGRCTPWTRYAAMLSTFREFVDRMESRERARLTATEDR